MSVPKLTGIPSEASPAVARTLFENLLWSGPSSA